MKFYCSRRALGGVAAGILWAATAAWAYRPLITEDAGVAGRWVAQTEISWDYLAAPGGGHAHIAQLAAIYGVGERIELSLDVPRAAVRGSEGQSHAGLGDLLASVKLLARGQTHAVPALTAKFSYKSVSAGAADRGLGTGARDYGLAAVASKTWPRFAFHATAGYLWRGEPEGEANPDYFQAGLAADGSLTNSLHWVGEVNGSRARGHRPARDPLLLGTGLWYAWTERLALDAAFRAGLTKDTPDWNTTLGLTATFQRRRIFRFNGVAGLGHPGKPDGRASEKLPAISSDAGPGQSQGRKAIGKCP